MKHDLRGVRVCGYIRAAAVVAAALGAVVASWGSAGFHGLPQTRAYPLEDIGFVARGPRLEFDRFGRLALIQEGVYAVLNDTVWINLSDDDVNRRHVVVNVIQAADGRAYYGARKSWGRVETGPEGRIRTVSLVPDDPPRWTLTATFNQILSTRDGVYFASWNGVVFMDFATGACQFHEISGGSCLFQIGDRVYVSSLEEAVSHVDIERGVIEPIPIGVPGPLVIDHAARLSGGRVYLAESVGRVWVFDGAEFTRWDGLERVGVEGPISAIEGLVDGGLAIAVVGRGVYLFDDDGSIRTALDMALYHRITGMACREAGVLWVATEDSIEKVLYGGMLTTFGQKLGLTVSWPVVESWNERLFVASEGKLYEATPMGPGLPSRFVQVPGVPSGGAWALASRGHPMLVGSSQGVHVMEPDGSFTPALDIRETQHLARVGEDLCFVIGPAEIAVLQFRDGRWVEAAARVPGLYYTPIVHGTENSAWVEMGGGGVARVWLGEGRIQVEVIESEPWTDSTWVNIGVIGDIVILGASRGNRRFYDERAGAWCEAPEIAALLDRPSQWIARARRDDRGVIWASHNEGVITFTPAGGDYVMDTVSFDQINDRYPMVHILHGGDVWIAAGQSLHHVEPGRTNRPAAALKPALVSVLDTGANTELLPARGDAGGPLVLPYARNNLAFRVFAGGYSWKRAPVYEYRLGPADKWITLDTGSLLSFKGLREGDYHLQVRMAENPAGAVAHLVFSIRPPWHRTIPAFIAYGLLLVVAVLGVVRWASHLERRRSRILEGLVSERTRQLEATMDKLNEETRNAATLAERNRLAGEIHDSLQQGLSGAILQLDSTLTLPSVAGEMRTRLSVVRNMVSYARQEVQHAVWDMESSLAEGVELHEALQRLTGLINSSDAVIDVEVEGEAFPVSRTVKHNLLRIAQEAATNAIRHASATRIHIHLRYGDDALVLTVSDDGVGFEPSTAMNGNVGHFGLRGIRSRAKKLHGDLSIRSSPGAGASIHVVVPHQAGDDTLT